MPAQGVAARRSEPDACTEGVPEGAGPVRADGAAAFREITSPWYISETTSTIWPDYQPRPTFSS